MCVCVKEVWSSLKYKLSSFTPFSKVRFPWPYFWSSASSRRTSNLVFVLLIRWQILFPYNSRYLNSAYIDILWYLGCTTIWRFYFSLFSPSYLLEEERKTEGTILFYKILYIIDFIKRFTFTNVCIVWKSICEFLYSEILHCFLS